MAGGVAGAGDARQGRWECVPREVDGLVAEHLDAHRTVAQAVLTEEVNCAHQRGPAMGAARLRGAARRTFRASQGRRMRVLSRP